MKLTKKCLQFCDKVNQRLYSLGHIIAQSFGPDMFCESYDVFSDGVRFCIYESIRSGGFERNEFFKSVCVSFETLLLDDPGPSIIIDQ